MKLSLIIPTYNRPKDIMRLMKNLNLQNKKPDEVIVVDASDTEETKLLIENKKEEFAFSINYYGHEKGLTKQRNFGVEKARYEIIGFSDDDTIYEPDFMARIVSIFENDEVKEIGGATGLVYNVGAFNIATIDEHLADIHDAADFSSFMKRFSARASDTWRLRLRKGLERFVFLKSNGEGTFCPIRCRFDGFTQLFSGVKRGDFLGGIAFYRREVFKQVQYSDFFQGYGFGEDVHFSLQVGRRWKLMVAGETACYHLHAPSGRPDLFRVGIMSTQNIFYIFKTYRKRKIFEYVLFWYFFSLNTILDVLPIFLLKNSGELLRLFAGRCYGGFMVLRNSFKR